MWKGKGMGSTILYPLFAHPAHSDPNQPLLDLREKGEGHRENPRFPMAVLSTQIYFVPF